MTNIIKASSFSPLNLKPQLIKLFLHYVIKDSEPRSALLYVQFLNHTEKHIAHCRRYDSVPKLKTAHLSYHSSCKKWLYMSNIIKVSSFFATEFEAPAKQVISSLRDKASSPKYNSYVLQIILILRFLYHWLIVFSFHTHILEKQTPTKIIKLVEETRAKYIYKKNALFLFNNWLVVKVNDTIRYLAKIQTNTAFGQVADKNIKVQWIAISLSVWNLYLYLAQYSLKLSPTFKANQRK